MATAPTLDRAAWLAERNTFIGGSEIYELLNIPQYGKGCARALAYRKTGLEPDYPTELPEDLFERGNELEPIVAAKYERETGRKVRRTASDEAGYAVTRRHPDHPYLGVHTDRVILAGFGDVKETGDLELKTHREGPFTNLMRRGIPEAHMFQVQHSLLVTGHKWGAFAVLWPDGWKMKHFDIQRDEQAIDLIKRQGEAFWNSKEKGELPAQLTDSEDDRCKVCAFRLTCRGEEMDAALAEIKKAEREGKQSFVQITDPSLQQAIADRQLLKREIKAAEEQATLLDERIKESVGETQAAIVGGSFKVYKRPMVVNRLDQKVLKSKEPAIYEQFTRECAEEYYRIYDL